MYEKKIMEWTVHFCLHQKQLIMTSLKISDGNDDG